MGKQHSRVQRKGLPGIGIAVSMVLVLSLLTGAAMPSGAGSAGGGMEAMAASDMEAMAAGGMPAAADMPSGVPESVKTRLAEARASYDGAMAAFEESRAEAEAGIEEDIAEDADDGAVADDDAYGDGAYGIDAFSEGDEDMAWPDDPEDTDPGMFSGGMPEIGYSIDPGDYTNVADLMDISAYTDAVGGEETGDREGIAGGEAVDGEGADGEAVDGADGEAAEAADGEAADGAGGSAPGTPGGELSAMASTGGLYIDLAAFRSVSNIEDIIDILFSYYTDNLLVINTGKPFNAGDDTLTVYMYSSRQALIWQAAYTGGAGSSYDDLIDVVGGGTVVIPAGGNITYAGKGDAVYVGGGKSQVIVDGGKISATNNAGYALDSDGEAYVLSGSVSATAGRAIYGSYVGVGGGTVSATTGKAILCRTAEVIGGAVKATGSKGMAIDSTNAWISKGAVSATTGYAINTDKANISGGTVSATSGTAIASNKAEILGGTVKATANKGIAIDSKETTISKGTVSATTGRAIYSERDNSKATVSGGTVSATSGYAIYANKVTISGGTVSATTGKAIVCATTKILGGTVKATGKDGDAIGTSDATVSGGTVSATTGTALYVLNGKVTGGTVKATLGEAVWVEHEFTVSGGTVSATSGKAIICSDPDAELYIKKGTVKATTGQAIGSRGPVYISGGTVSATDSKGVAIEGPAGYPGSDVNVSAGKVTSKAGYAIDTQGDISITGGTVTGARSSDGDIAVSGKAVVNGVETGAAGKTITVSGSALVTSSKGSAVIAKGKVEVKDGGSVTNSHATDPAVSSAGEVDINNGLVAALGKNSDAIDAAGKVVLDGGMVLAAGTGAAIRTPSEATFKGGEAYGFWGSAIRAEGPGSAVAVSGGVADSYGGDYGIEADGDVSITGGVVAAEEGTAVFGGDGVGSLVFSSGFVFAGKEPIDWDDDQTVAPTGDGVKCKWDNYDPWNSSYLIGDGAGLAWEPAGATVVWDKEELGYTAFGVRYENGPSNKGFHEVVDAMVFEPAAEKDALAISPNHAILTKPDQEVTLVAALNADGAGSGDIKWSIDAADEGAIYLNGSKAITADGDSVAVTAPDMLDAQTVRVTAEYFQGGKLLYTAAATVEIMPDGISGTDGVNGGLGVLTDGTILSLLESKVTVNRAKITGARLPVLITKRDISALSVNPPKEAPTGSFAADGVRLEYKNSKGKWVPVDYYTARICPTDDRYIEISADLKAKPKKNVRVSLHRKSGGEDSWFQAKGNLELAVTTKYPKIKLKAEGTPLNLKFPDKPVKLTAASADGLCSLVYMEGQKAKDDGKVYLEKGEIKIDAKKLKSAATVKTRVLVAVAGYKQMPASKWPKLNVKVVNALPKLKLSKKSVTLLKAGTFGSAPFTGGEALDVGIGLLPGDKNMAFQEGYTVESVTLSSKNAKKQTIKSPTALDIDDTDCKDGIVAISPKSTTKTGNTYLKVEIKLDPLGTSSYIYLPLKVTVKSADGVTLKASPKAATVNTNHPVGVDGADIIDKADDAAKIADIPFALNTANLALDDWDIKSVKIGTKEANAEVKDTLADAIWATASENMLALSVRNKDALARLTGEGKATTYTLTLYSPKLPKKTFTFKLTVSDMAPSFTTKAGKAKIDVAKPGSAMDVTVALKNTGAGIESVTLWDVPDDSDSDNECKDFKVLPGSVNGMKFKVVRTHDEVVPKVTQKLGVKIELANGDVLCSWDKGADGVTALGAPLAIAPTQTVPKTVQSAKTVTFYKSAPLEDRTIEFGFKKPEAYRLGAARISEGSLAPFVGNGFELAQSGEGAWLLRFDGKAKPVLGSGKALKSSYVLTVELWAEGTYELDADGRPVALTDPADAAKAAKTKPAKAKVTVKIK